MKVRWLVKTHKKPNYLHSCFEGTMARATDQNKEEFKALLQTMDTKSVANFDKVTFCVTKTHFQQYLGDFTSLSDNA